MKCCSLQIKDLDFHYKRMSTMYYKLNGFNDPSLKHVFVASLLKEIQPELQRQFTIHQLDIANLSLWKICQLATNCLERLCEQKEFDKDLIENKQPFKSACKKPHLSIKCKSEKDCTCSTKNKSTSENQKFRKEKPNTFHIQKNLINFSEKRTLTSPLNPRAVVVLFVK